MRNIFSKHRKGVTDEAMFEIGSRGIGTLVLLAIFIAIMALAWPFFSKIINAISAFYICIKDTELGECLKVIKISLGI